MKSYKLTGTAFGAINVSGRCPACGEICSFLPISTIPDAYTQETAKHNNGQVFPICVGVRMCPNCHSHLFVAHSNGKLISSSPVQKIDFDSSEIPEDVKKLIEEAIICFGNECYTATAIMLRRTLEQVCSEKGCKGNNLHERLEDLKKHVIMSAELHEGAMTLKILGNDAAHVEAAAYMNIGKEEVEIALDVCKKILESVYQHSALVRKLKGLKKATP